MIEKYLRFCLDCAWDKPIFWCCKASFQTQWSHFITFLLCFETPSLGEVVGPWTMRMAISSNLSTTWSWQLMPGELGIVLNERYFDVVKEYCTISLDWVHFPSLFKCFVIKIVPSKFKIIVNYNILKLHQNIFHSTPFSALQLNSFRNEVLQKMHHSNHLMENIAFWGNYVSISKLSDRQTISSKEVKSDMKKVQSEIF